MSKENEKIQEDKLSPAKEFTSDLKSRQSVRASLDEISTKFNASRDGLIEYSIQRLLPIIIRERTKHEMRKKILLTIKKHFQQGEKMLNNIKKQLGHDDPIINSFAILMTNYQNTIDNMELFLDRSKCIETFDENNMNF